MTPLSSLNRSDLQWQDEEICHHQLLRLLPVAVFTVDAKGLVTFCNRAAVDLWGREPVLRQDSWHASWTIHDSEGRLMPVEQFPITRTLRAGKAVRGERMIVERPDGKRFLVLSHPEPIWDARGNVVGAVDTLVCLDR